jgi:aspartate/methionine/tyrosine aminotransferase
MAERKTAFIKHLEAGTKSILGAGLFTCAYNPDIVNLGTAENKILDDKILPFFQHRPDLVLYNLGYIGAANDIPLRNALAALYRDHFGIAGAEGSQFVFGSGISFLVERIGLVLCEPGDIVLIPKPAYGAFEPDLRMCGAKVEYIDLDHLPPAPPAESRLLILTNPGNPYGDLIEHQTELLQWAYQNPNLHIITDDVYALSCRHIEKYQSIAGRPDAKPSRVHQFYGVSKDWGLAGIHFGCFWSADPELVRMTKLATGCYCCASTVSFTLGKLLGDVAVRDEIIATFKERLIQAEQTAIATLTNFGLKFKVFDNSLFIMLDLTEIAGTDESELDVWRELLNKYRVHILPGKAGFHCDEPGWYRMLFSVPNADLIEGITRIARGVEEIRKSRKSE